MAQYKNKYHNAESLSFLEPEQYRALCRFNTEVLIAGASTSEAVDHARIRAVRLLKPKELKELAGAFEAIWPHWFVNGRSELAEGTHKDVQQLCIEVVRKISAGYGPSVTSGLEWLGRMGGMRLTGGRHRVAVENYKDRKGGRGIREVKICFIHHDRRSINNGRCSRCNSRYTKLVSLGYDPGKFPNGLYKDIMEHAGFKRGRGASFVTQATEMIKVCENKHGERYKVI